uniref:Uncharacterized protein LOC111122393 isoform X3 n=1 Tax=Crassostrea virginica TaxID=6565 RepID=A0A8B8CXB2_CRAVI|nr:uncharacterized protein LOC111122393 isoform X3 [Crassostrea virginica]
MLLSRKLKIFGILTFVGVVLVTVSFVSPGWINFKTEYFQNTKISHFSAGPWYFFLCYQNPLPGEMTPRPYYDDGIMMDLQRKDGCEVHSYENDLDTNMGVGSFRYLNEVWLLEIRILSSIGVFCAVLGFIGTIVFIRREARSRCAGLLACISLSISGGTYIAAVVKTVTTTNFIAGPKIKLLCPWGLVLGGIGGLLILLSAIGHLCIISRNKSDENGPIYQMHEGTNQEIISMHPYTTIAPPGYHASVYSTISNR